MESRDKVFQENINRRVLLDWVRIAGLQNPRKKKFDVLLEDLAHDIIGYPKDRPQPFSWPTAAGEHARCQAIRARISYDFWRYFMKEGRKALYEYNRKNDSNINITREKTLTLQDQDRLGLYIRKIIKEEVRKNGLTGPDVSLVKGMLKIGNLAPMKPTIAAIKLDIDMSAWSGIPLLDMLTSIEKDSVERGYLQFGTLTLPGINLNTACTQSGTSSSTAIITNNDRINSKQNGSPTPSSTNGEDLQPRKRSHLAKECEIPSKMKKKDAL